MTQETVAGRSNSILAGARGTAPEFAVRFTGALLAVAVAAVHVADQGGITALASPAWIGWGYRLVEIGGIVTALVLLLPVPGWPRPAWPGPAGPGAVLPRPALPVPARFRPARTARSGPAWLGAVWLEPDSLGWAAGVLLGAGPFLGYIASRSVGLPGDPGDVGNWDYWVGTVSLLVEAALILLSVGMLLAARQRR